MLHLISQRTYTTEQWELMQRAHVKASEMLRRCSHTHEHANRLADRNEAFRPRPEGRGAGSDGDSHRKRARQQHRHHWLKTKKQRQNDWSYHLHSPVFLLPIWIAMILCWVFH
ncbi:hypothetical protein N8E89_24325 (plasmid) [Phyllobacterium sp. A18/5-2]|uniref:hypothetical protein n=1 Tax=Phyllobacterium sp. A18/5-2 TaxID=2978392 RepID=UPI0021CAB720|nr:hypothetical protein [Phyllobacterium sp. A18/5-2]UXN66297.1 hypothetical protein N8E89_24325 [Phyllobacterium sp. A18/5-2]